MLTPAAQKPCCAHPRAVVLSWWRTAVRVAIVCMAVVCCGEDAGASGEQFPGNRFYTLPAPGSGADTGGPEALPETPALPAAADRRNPWLSKTPLAPVGTAPQFFLLPARPIPRSPPPAIAAPAPARMLSPVFFAA